MSNIVVPYEETAKYHHNLALSNLGGILTQIFLFKKIERIISCTNFVLSFCAVDLPKITKP
jgi:hypothetical protein